MPFSLAVALLTTILPLGVPPDAEDPLMQRVAPEECLAYFSWSGMAKADPASPNGAERLLAEPEVQHLFARVNELLEEAVGGLPGPDMQRALARDALTWGRKLLVRPGAVFIERVTIREGEKEGEPRGDVTGGAVFRLTDDVDEARRTLERLALLLPEGWGRRVEIGGESYYRLQAADKPESVPVFVGIRRNYLLVGLGEGSVEGMLRRAAGNPPAWLTAAKTRLALERVSTVSYVNLALARQLAERLAQDQLPPALLEALGAKQLRSYVSVTGLDAAGYASRTLLTWDGKPQGLLRGAVAEPLTAADLSPIPRDVALAAAARFDPADAVQVARDVATQSGLLPPGALDDLLDRSGIVTGVDLRRDLLPALGNVWCLYSPKGEGGFLALTLVVRVRDRAKAAKLLDTLAERLDELAQADEPDAPFGPDAPVYVRRYAVGGHQVTQLNFADEVPVAPTWCLTDRDLVVSLYPQGVRSYLARGPEFQSLARDPHVAAQFQRGGPLALGYFDTATFTQLYYPMLQAGLAAMTGEARRFRGPQVDVSILPSVGTITRHMRPSLLTVRGSEAGLELTEQHTLPGATLSGSAPTAVALLLPAVQAAREAARRAQSSNNLRQIGIAALSFESASKRLPAAYSVDKDGKPLLSWRVHMLPYLEEQNLFNQFKLDEPWDSEHNKQLIQRMPSVYFSPNSRRAREEGYTNYLAVRGKDSVIVPPELDADGKPVVPPGARPERFPTGIRIAQIVDGMSNTVMAVEVNDDAAAIWTKPDDWEYDPENPGRGLFGLRPVGALALFADCHTSILAESIDPVVLRALLTRSGREAVDAP